MSSISTASTTGRLHGGRWHAEGPWLRDDTGRKVTLQGVTYGPFRPNAKGEPWPEAEQLRADLALIAQLGFNAVRVYEPASDLLLQACTRLGLRLLAGIPWTQHVDFLASERMRDDAHARVANEAHRLADHACVAGIVVGNEIEKTLVRWMGPAKVLRFVEDLISTARECAPGKLVGYASYPSTEYLVPRNADFIAFNVFLESPDAFRRYVQHLMNLAGGRPLFISEFGLDTRTHGETAQAEALVWQRCICEEEGVAGHCWFSFTDAWYRGGEEVTDWDFGLVTRDRMEKVVVRTCREIIAKPPASPALQVPPERISVIVCSRNGSATLEACLEALGKQTHPNHEVLVIDDGSTDAVPEIARRFPFVRYVRQEHAGLSAARNYGMHEATGTLLAYTDDDCIPDEDWLTYVCHAFEDPQCVAAGGPNLPPPPRNLTESCVAVAPGAPSHVLLNDEEAEHLPGCNLVIRKVALQAVGGFREEYRSAGDDVDVCWRLQAHGGKLRFVPAALVWHHRRFTISAYLRQQLGYGRAEAMLVQRYPHRFAWLGGARWRGAIYGDGLAPSLRTGALVRFGRFGNALFQTIYAQNSASLWDWATGLPWLVTSLSVLGYGVWTSPSLTPRAATLVGALMLLLLLLAAWRRIWHLPPSHLPSVRRRSVLLWLLNLSQPIVRDWGRLSGMVRLGARPTGKLVWPWKLRHGSWSHGRGPSWISREYWSEAGVGRDQFLQALEDDARLNGTLLRAGGLDDEWDLKVRYFGVINFTIATVTEYHSANRRLTRVGVSGPLRVYFPETVGYLAVLLLATMAHESLLDWAEVSKPEPWLWRLAIFPILLGIVLPLILLIRRPASLVESAAKRCGLAPEVPTANSVPSAATEAH